MKKTIQIKNVTIGEGIPKICVPVIGRTREEILTQTEAAVAQKPDLLEWRADFFEECMEETAVSETMEMVKERLGEIPLIFTFRTAREGGNRQISTKNYVNLLTAAAKAHPDLTDVELKMEGIKESGLIGRLQSGTPQVEEMLSILGEMELSGADILKLAVMPQSTQDLLKLLYVTEYASRRTEHPLITMSMGGCGALSRIAGEQFGSAVTFGAVEEASAPGQIPIAELREMLEKLHEFGGRP